MSMIAPAPLAPVIAHRGASGHAPENTLAALRLAGELGARCVEIDVCISADDIAYVHHDETLDRCTNGSGRVCVQPSSSLDRLFAGGGHTGFEQERLPRLTAAIRELLANDLALNLEIKPSAGLEERTARAVCEVIGSCWPASAAIVLSSFDETSLHWVRRWLPDTPRALITGAVPADILDRLEHLDCRNLHCAADELTPESAAAVLDAGYGLYCYTVNDVELARAVMAMGAHGVFTDFPDRLLTEIGNDIITS